MELPDCPPGTEGYEDSVIENPKKPNLDDPCTKAEQEFQEHLNSLKIKLEDGSTRSMVERRGRDISGKWIYLCYPCAAMCSGESILQTHISGKKHKTKLAMRSIWPKSIFEEHPYVQTQKKGSSRGGDTTEKVLQKMAEEVDLHNKEPSELDERYNKYRSVRCHIQDTVDKVKAPLLGLEYLIEHPPEQAHYEPSYICTLCIKQGHPRTIINHMTCYWHRYNYLMRHFQKASEKLTPFRNQANYREGMTVIINRLVQRIEDKYGRLKPVNIDKEEYEKDKERIHQWIFKGKHFAEQPGATFEEVVDADLIMSLHKSNMDCQEKTAKKPAVALTAAAFRPRDPSPPVVAAPTRPRGIRERHASSADALSDISDEPPAPRSRGRDDRARDLHRDRFAPYPDRRRPASPVRMRYTAKITAATKNPQEKKQAPNYHYKLKLAGDKCKQAEDSAKKTLAYHEKNPEKHPLYPEEWKKFWNRRYKEIQSEGKDPSKHDFKPEWILFWTERMKQLHEDELRTEVVEIYRKLCLTPPPAGAAPPADTVRRDRDRDRDDVKKKPEPRLSPARRRSPEPRRREPERRRSPEPRRKSPERRHSPRRRERSPLPFRDNYRDVRSYNHSQSREPDHRQRSPPPHRLPRTRSRSPAHKARTHITLEGARSPLSRRGEASRNKSPQSKPAPSLQTVLISDDELKPDDNLSPWNSDDMDSLPSLPDAKSPIRSRSRTNSTSRSRVSRPRMPAYRPEYSGRSAAAEPQDLGPAENIVATLRLLVALEDYLGSLGPKIIDLLTEALRMEKERANSSEELLERESALVLIETAKEKLKGAVQAGLVPGAAAPAVRAAVVRAAATLHAADTRLRRQAASKPAVSAAAAAATAAAAPGGVDRAQIAQQMAAALIAQGKTDVSSAELAQLVDAVVSMAEAKKREATAKRKVEARARSEKQARPLSAAALAGTASALQMLQSAYDEDKKNEKEEAPDAMDGLSDSDLETLLKNFNELSAEEQHSLIAYLKKLEAKEPSRVERLRQYVSAAGPTDTPGDEPAEALKISVLKEQSLKLVAIESDDDDYTVEEVFESATKKVKEDQIRQEMEIVKKSLEEAKDVESEPAAAKAFPIIDLTNNSSAVDLLALVQASLKSTAAKSNPLSQAPDVVSTKTQPRSFGDLPEPQMSAATALQQSIQAILQMPKQNPIRQDYKSPPRNYNNLSQKFEPMQKFNQPRQGFNEPRQGFNEPRQGFNEPRHGFNEPRQGFNEPRQGFNEPRQGFNEPRQGFNEPRQGFNEPRQGFNEPRQNFNEPRQNFNEPLRNFDEPDEPRQNFNEPRQNFNDPSQNFNDAPQNYNEPTAEFDQPPMDYDSTQNFNEPSQDYQNPSDTYDEPTQEFNEPAPNLNNSPQNYDDPQQDYDSSQNYNNPQKFNNPQQNFNNPPRNFGDSSQNYNNRPQSYNDPPQNFNNPPRSFNNPSQNYNNPQQNYNRPRNFDEPQTFNNPKGLQSFNNSLQRQGSSNNPGFRDRINPGNFGGNRNFQNDQFNKGPAWEQDKSQDKIPVNTNRGGPLLVPSAFESKFSQGPGPRDNFSSRPPASQQFGNFRGRGGGGRGANFRGAMRGRGRGYY